MQETSFPISTIVAILVPFLIEYIKFKSELDDLIIDIDKNAYSIEKKKKNIRSLKLMTLFLLLLVLVPFYYPSIVKIIDNMKINYINSKNEDKSENVIKVVSNIDDEPMVTYYLKDEFGRLHAIDDSPAIEGYLLKLTPFREGFFSDSNFKFSYITGTIFSIIIINLCFLSLCFVIPPNHEKLMTAIPAILFYGLIWANNFISLFLTHCVIHCFALFAIVFNLVAYIIIFLIIAVIITLLDEYIFKDAPDQPDPL